MWKKQNVTEEARKKNRTLLLYLAIAFAGAWLLQLAGIAVSGFSLTGGGTEPAAQLIVAVSMYMPLIAVWISHGKLSGAKTGIRWKLKLRGNGKWILAAWFLPAVSALTGAALYFALFPGRFDKNAGYLQAMLPSGVQLPADMGTLAILQLAAAVSYAPLINVFFAFGEEAGWRGYLTPCLQERLGKRAGLVASGLIWGVWHFPLILFAGYEYGVGYPGAPFTGLIGMCLFTVSVGILLSYLYEKSGSIWLPSLAHGSINAVAAAGLLFTPAGTTGYLLGPTMAGLISGIPLMLAAAVLFWRSRELQSCQR